MRGCRPALTNDLMPMLLAVPSTWAIAASIELAFQVRHLIVAISRIWSVSLADRSRDRRSAVPLVIPAALRRRSGAGGVLRTNVNERSSKIVICAGITWPALSAVFSLYDLVNSTMLMP